MEAIDPTTGRALSEDAIQRVLFIATSVHVYNIPPMVPGKGHVAATWTADDGKLQIFTSRLRIIETSETLPNGTEKMKTDIVLEDPSNGQLFAAAPYTAQAVVEQVSDSSRFFAVRVQDPTGRKATLGIGFEERSEAFDFSVALQEARKALGLDQDGAPGKKPAAAEAKESSLKRDLSLKPGETITVNLPGRFSRRKPEPESSSSPASLSSFSLPPPPSASSAKSAGILPPPPSAPSSNKQQFGSSSNQPSAKDLGFDDGKFGEFA